MSDDTRVHTIWRVWAKRLQQARIDRGLSQSALADELHVRQTAISKWESGKQAPRDEFKILLAEALDVPLARLFAWPERLAPNHNAKRS